MKTFNEFLTRYKTKEDRIAVYKELKKNHTTKFEKFLFRFCEERGVGTWCKRTKVPYYRVYVEKINVTNAVDDSKMLSQHSASQSLVEAWNVTRNKNAYIIYDKNGIKYLLKHSKNMGITIRYEEM